MTLAKYPVSGGGGGGGITGPGSSVNNGLALWNGTGGDVLKDGQRPCPSTLSQIPPSDDPLDQTVIESLEEGWPFGPLPGSVRIVIPS